MRRWNGWGDDTYSYALPASAAHYLETLVGPGTAPQDAGLEDILAEVPSSKLPDHPLVFTDPLLRLRHARGQSLPDLIALRSGRIGEFPAGVAFPSREKEVRELIQFAGQVGARLIPYGGGTSVVGHINPLPGDAPSLTLALNRMNSLLRLDPDSLLATFEAGIAGPDLEALLRSRGFILGHYPQSFELSTLGGWIATRSSGQQSLRYGRIEKLFAGGRLLTPQGDLELPTFPASAAGPDLRELVLGSEGRLGVITEATIRISSLPEKEAFHGVFFPSFESGRAAVSRIVQENIPVSMLRLSTASETRTTLALAGHEHLIGLLENVLSVRGMGTEKCLLLAGFSGRPSQARQARQDALEIARKHGGVHVGRTFGDQWHKSRFRTPYLRNTLWEKGYAVDTLETAVDWSRVQDTIQAVEGALYTALAGEGEKVHVFTHLSHVYPFGSSIYTTYLFRLAHDPDKTLRRWQTLKRAANRAIISCGGTISHQHGVGIDHKSYLHFEKGELGMGAIAHMIQYFDPQGLMNPGKLIGS